MSYLVLEKTSLYLFKTKQDAEPGYFYRQECRHLCRECITQSTCHKNKINHADEFQSFICPSMAEILSGARKYGLGFILAHQELRHLVRAKELASAVLSNAFTRIVFRVSDSDARSLSDGFAHCPANELQKLPIGSAICRVERPDNDFSLEVLLPDWMERSLAEQCRLVVGESSKRKVAIPRAEVEALLLQQVSLELTGPEAKAGKAKEKPIPASIPPTGVVQDTKKAAPSEAGAALEAETPPKPSSQGEDSTHEPELMPEQSGARKGGNRHRLLQERIKAAGDSQRIPL